MEDQVIHTNAYKLSHQGYLFSLWPVISPNHWAFAIQYNLLSQQGEIVLLVQGLYFYTSLR